MALVLALAKIIFSMYHYSVLKRQRNLVKIGLFPFELDFDQGLGTQACQYYITVCLNFYEN